MIDYVIFDLDGVLLDTAQGIIESAKFAAKSLGYKDLSFKEWLSFVGPSIQESFIKHFKCSHKDAQRAANIFRSYYKNEALLLATPYEGIYDLLISFTKMEIKMAIATYKSEDYALKLLRYFGFDRYCNPIHGADNFNVLSKADIVNKCIKELGAIHNRTVLIGDTYYDAVGASSSQIHFIGVTYGFGFYEKREVDEYMNIGVASTPIEILRCMEKFNRGGLI